MTTIVPIVAIERIAGSLVVERRAVGRSWGAAVVGLVVVVTLLSILSVGVFRGRDPGCAVHWRSSSAAAAAVVKAPDGVRRRPLDERTGREDSRECQREEDKGNHDHGQGDPPSPVIPAGIVAVAVEV